MMPLRCHHTLFATEGISPKGLYPCAPPVLMKLNLLNAHRMTKGSRIKTRSPVTTAESKRQCKQRNAMWRWCYEVTPVGTVVFVHIYDHTGHCTAWHHMWKSDPWQNSWSYIAGKKKMWLKAPPGPVFLAFLKIYSVLFCCNTHTH